MIDVEELECLQEQAYNKGRNDENIYYRNYVENYFISKDKIREKIEELQQEIKDEYVDYDWNKNSIISVLQELLKEGE